MIAHGKQSGYRRFTLVCRETKTQTASSTSVTCTRQWHLGGSVTGTAHAAAAIYLDREGLLPLGDGLC